jgi:glycosyltransferase involved in cell wall biosynthesis
MRIVVTGTRGVPNILGGVETHCEELYPYIVQAGHEVILIRRKAYVNEPSSLKFYNGIKLVDIWTPKQKSLEAIIHTFLAILYARLVNANILHVHAIGPAIMIPFARLLGLKVVMTHHGPDYDRQKWNPIAKKILRVGEYLGVRYANSVIVISKLIQEIVLRRYAKANTYLIFNGVNDIKIPSGSSVLSTFGLKENEYIVAVGRFVPEKGFHDLLDAYNRLNIPEKLVFVGDADHSTSYSEKLKQDAIDAGVILTGFKKGKELFELFGNAKLFVLPSYHEGLPIALLEALSLGLNVLVSDIDANLQIGLNETEYFHTGNVKDLACKLQAKIIEKEFYNYKQYIQNKYNWEGISKQTLGVYKSVFGKENLALTNESK